jgi:hypothetical protein
MLLGSLEHGIIGHVLLKPQILLAIIEKQMTTKREMTINEKQMTININPKRNNN